MGLFGVTLAIPARPPEGAARLAIGVHGSGGLTRS